MTEIRVEERHFNSTRDIEGAVRDAWITDTESEAFMKYMKEHRVWEKYQKNHCSKVRSYYVRGELQWLTADAYFHGWTYDVCGERPRNEMCYIIVMELHSNRENLAAN